MKNKTAGTIDAIPVTSAGHIPTKTTQPTEEQIRYAKLSQINTKEEQKIQEKIREVSEVTQKAPDIVFVALHDCNYDTQLAIQSIIEGQYDDHQDEWKTTTAKKGKKPAPSVSSSSNHFDSEDKKNIKENNDSEMRPPAKSSRISRGGSHNRGRSSSSNRKSDDRFDGDQVQENPRERNRGGFSDRGRGRGRGRGSRGGRGSGRGGFGRGNFRGSSRGGRGGFSRGGFTKTNASDEYQKVGNGGGFGEPASESWDIEDETTNVKQPNEDWGSKEVESDSKIAVRKDDWSKDYWSTEQQNEETNNKAHVNDNLFAQENPSVSWAQINGQDIVSNWGEEETVEQESEKYKHKIVDSAVLRVIPPSSTSGEVTSYQPTNDISRYINTPSNQFPSSHQAGGLTSSLTDRAFTLPTSTNSSTNDNLPQSMASLQLISGVTESHKLEQEQLSVPKTQQLQKVVNKKPPVKFRQIPSQPVVMPRSAQLVNDVEDQYSGLEFGSGPPMSSEIDCGVNQEDILISSSSVNTELVGRVLLQTVPPMDMSDPSLMNSLVDPAVATGLISSSTTVDQSLNAAQLNYNNDTPPDVDPAVLTANLSTTKTESIPKTPPGFRPLDQNTNPHYIGSPGRGRGNLVPEPIPFPSATNISADVASTTTLNAFSPNVGLGTNVVTEVSGVNSFSDQVVYNQQENINGQKIIAEQRALAEKQYLAEHQRLMSEQRDREQTIADQRAFAEQKSLAQQKLLAAQRSHVSDTGKKMLNDKVLHQRQNISPKPPTDNTYHNIHKKPVNTTLSPPPGVLPLSSYSSPSVLSNDMLSLTTATGVQTTAKMQTATSKSVNGPQGGVLPLNLYPGVQHGMIPAYQHLHGYNNYEELLQMQRMPVSPYHYDVSVFQAQVAAAGTPREGLQTYPGTDSKFNRPADDPSPVSLPQANPHVAAAAHQQAAYLNAATGQFPYGYYYQPNVLPQGGVYPTFTTPSVYQVAQGKGVAGNQYQSQYQSPTHQQGTTVGSHEFSKSTYHNNMASQQSAAVAAAQNKVPPQNVASSSTNNSGGVHQSVFKSQYNQEGKGFLGNSPSSIQPNMHIQNQAAHLNNINHYLLQQQNMMTHGGQVSAHLNQVDAHRGQVHQVAPFSGTAQPKQQRDAKGSYQSYWSGNR